ncbi:MAG TPA: nucleoside triphosphate pyrophosphohydrolase [Thermoanaerobaculia bacterium]|nr:nucleoside triphosphate pyrophosphohydrolase [Thermoanaerobaculia bacterium]
MGEQPPSRRPTPEPPAPSPGPELDRLVLLVRRLRAPDGCPWDREQGIGDLRAYLTEEAHEVADAIDRRDWSDLRGELGDLLFQVCFAAALAEDEGRFTLAAAIAEVHDKMIERHPHVFGDQRLETAGEVASAWERRKRERSDRSLLAGVPPTLPALTGAYRLGQKAAGVGFDWRDAREVLDKVQEEIAELEAALAAPADEGAVEAEVGDLLLSVASLARHVGVDPEAALARANLRFRNRFAHVEESLGRRLVDGSLSPDELRGKMEELWHEAKRLEADR